MLELQSCGAIQHRGEGNEGNRRQYIQRILSHTDGQEPLKVQAATPKKLQRLVGRASASKLRKRPAPDKWSIAEIVAHLADAELVGSWRIRLILGAPGAPIRHLIRTTGSPRLHYDKRDTRKALEQFRVVRETNLALLKTLTPDQWKHSGLHSERGRNGRTYCAHVCRPRPKPHRANRTNSRSEKVISLSRNEDCERERGLAVPENAGFSLGR